MHGPSNQRISEGPRDWQNMVALKRFIYTEVPAFSYDFTMNGRSESFVKPRTSLHREVHFHCHESSECNRIQY